MGFFKRLCGEHSIEYIKALQYFGTIHAKLNLWPEAIENYTKAVELVSKNHQGNNKQVASLFLDLGKSLAETTEYK